MDNTGILKHKDVSVAKILYKNGHPFAIQEIYDESHLPPGVFDIDTFCNWLDNRNMPGTRAFASNLFEKFQITYPSEISAFCHNASLTDCYWFADQEEVSSGVTWESVNPRKVAWSESGEAIFVGHPELAQDFESPDFATGGRFPKVWVKQPDNIFLLKMDRTNGRNTFAEIFASELADFLNLSHTPYFFSITGGVMCSGCPCITSDNEEMVSVAQLLEDMEGTANIEAFMEDIGMGDDFSRMLVFDYLIGNWYRSLDDIAIIRNPDDLSIIGMSPLYDHGDAFTPNDDEQLKRQMMLMAKKHIGAMDNTLLNKEEIFELADRIAAEMQYQEEDLSELKTDLEQRINVYNALIENFR